jgi:hypothetical protein
MQTFHEWLSQRDEGFFSTLGQLVTPPAPSKHGWRAKRHHMVEKLQAMQDWIKAGKQGPPPYDESDPDWEQIHHFLTHPEGEPDINDMGDYNAGVGANPGA